MTASTAPSRKIWIIDDDDEMVDAVSLMLQLINCHVQGFPGARPAAEALLAGGRPDLMIVDINMPEVSGLDLVEFVRRRAEWTQLPILMLSTEAADVTVDRALGLGADGYVTKPVTLEELEKAMKAAFQKHTKGSSQHA